MHAEQAVGDGSGAAVGDGSGTDVGAGWGAAVGEGCGTAVGPGWGTLVGAGIGTWCWLEKAKSLAVSWVIRTDDLVKATATANLPLMVEVLAQPMEPGPQMPRSKARA